MAALFYNNYNNGLVASTSSERPQRAFDTITDLFDRVCLHRNVRKTVIRICQTYLPPRGN